MDYVGYVKLRRATRGREGSPLCHIKDTVDVPAVIIISYVLKNAKSPNIVDPTMLAVVASVCTWLKV